MSEASSASNGIRVKNGSTMKTQSSEKRCRETGVKNIVPNDVIQSKTTWEAIPIAAKSHSSRTRARRKMSFATRAIARASRGQDDERMAPASVIAKVIEAVRKEIEIEIRHHRGAKPDPHGGADAWPIDEGAVEKSTRESVARGIHGGAHDSRRGQKIEASRRSCGVIIAGGMTQSLAGKVALITGASSAQGRAFAIELARAGAKVFGVARREEQLRSLVAEIGASGADAAYHVADVRSVPAVYDLVDVVLARYKRIDILINAAAVGHRGPLENWKRGEIGETLETNLAGAIYLTQAALAFLRKARPRTSSMSPGVSGSRAPRNHPCTALPSRASSASRGRSHGSSNPRACASRRCASDPVTTDFRARRGDQPGSVRGFESKT